MQEANGQSGRRVYAKRLPNHILSRDDWADCLQPIINVMFGGKPQGYAWRRGETYEFVTTESVCEAILAGEIAVDFVYNDDEDPAAITLTDLPADAAEPLRESDSGCLPEERGA
jgi:hypothetical protein